MKIYSHNTNEEVINGSLAFPGDTLILEKDLAIFIEIFGVTSDKFALKNFPPMKFSFDKFIVNGKEKTVSAVARYSVEFPKLIEVTYKDEKLYLSTEKKLKFKESNLKKGFYFEPIFDETQK